MPSYPIITKPELSQTPAPGPAATGHGQNSGQALGINRERGEGGFWGRVAFQDADVPWRYAFVQQYRMLDASAPAALGGTGEVRCFDQHQDNQSGGGVFGRNQGSTFTTPPGQRSVWNVGSPDASGAPDPDTAYSPGGTVLNWAAEINQCQSVPIGAYVWIRDGETYDSNPLVSADVPRTDYTFQWSGPIWAKLVAAHKVSESDTDNDAQYAWIEYYRQRLTGDPEKMVWRAAVNGRTSVPVPDGLSIVSPIVGTLQFPAREVNGNNAVPTGGSLTPGDANYGAIVRLYQSNVTAYNSDASVYDQEWLFEYVTDISGRGKLTQDLYGCESASAVLVTYDANGNQTSGGAFVVYDPENKTAGWLEFAVDANGVPYVPSGTCFDWRLRLDTGHREIDSFGACCVPGSGGSEVPESGPHECGVPCPPGSCGGKLVLTACAGSGSVNGMKWEPVASGLSVTIVTAALTTLGSQGSQTYVNGILVSQVQAT